MASSRIVKTMTIMDYQCNVKYIVCQQNLNTASSILANVQ